MNTFFKKSFVVIVATCCILISCAKTQQTSNDLARSVPEAEGVSSRAIITFLDSAAKSKHEFHSIMILRHGKVIAEGWWNPYRADLKHTLYSTSKSFISTAIGFAVTEKKLTVNDKVLSFFPESKPDSVSPYLAELRVRDLLSMSAGQEPDPTFAVVSRDTNWVKSFLAVPIIHEPGTKFLYNTLATYMLSAIVQKVTREKVLDYLTPRLFNSLGIKGMDWETDLNGINTGGWGLRLKTEDMAKFGQLLLKKGNWNGTQILPKEWIEEATTLKIYQAPDLPQSKRDSSDWMQGYCYQFWRCRHNAFRADGAYGQFIVIIPEKDAVVAITAETSDMQSELNLVWGYLLPAFSEKKLPEDEKTADELKRRLSSLALSLPEKGADTAMASALNNKTYKFEKNDKHIQNISFQFKDGICTLTIKTDAATSDISFGQGKWLRGETIMRGPSLLSGALENFTGLPPSKIAGAYYWKDDRSLELALRFVESPHTQYIICHFDNDFILLNLNESFNSKAEPGIEGTVQK